MLVAALLVSIWPWGWSATYIIVLKDRALRGAQGATCIAFLPACQLLRNAGHKLTLCRSSEQPRGHPLTSPAGAMGPSRFGSSS